MEPQGDDYSAPAAGGPAALVVQSLTDACNDPADSSKVYNMLTGTKWFLALSDATHLGPYIGDGAAAATVEQVTVGFFDLVLRDGGGDSRSSRATRQPDRREHDLERRQRPAVPGAAVHGDLLRRAVVSGDGLTGRQDDRAVYLDHAATTPMRAEAVAAMLPFLADRYGNPSGSHTVARTARRALDDAREELAELLGAGPADVVFTSGGTEADNLAVSGVAAGAGAAPRAQARPQGPAGGPPSPAGPARPAVHLSSAAPSSMPPCSSRAWQPVAVPWSSTAAASSTSTPSPRPWTSRKARCAWSR